MTATATAIRPETPADVAAIRAVHLAAFPTPAEADLVERLRGEGDAAISLVAQDGAAVVGHVMFSRMRAPFRALGLAPVAVILARRRQGIGARLIRAGLALARESGWDGVFVLGAPTYYERFGFSAGAAAGFSNAYAGPHFMAVALRDGRLPATAGEVAYAPAFAAPG